MTKRAIVGAAVVAVCVGASTMRAETRALVQDGAWKAFWGTTHSGRPVCGVSQETSDTYFGLKRYSGDITFTIQMGTKGWTLANQQKVKVLLRFDANSPWSATATAMHFADGGAGLEFQVDMAEAEQFMAEFGKSNLIGIQFPESGSAEWVVSLAGSRTVQVALLGCVRSLK
jgi:hypothetical protein